MVINRAVGFLSLFVFGLALLVPVYQFVFQGRQDFLVEAAPFPTLPLMSLTDFLLGITLPFLGIISGFLFIVKRWMALGGVLSVAASFFWLPVLMKPLLTQSQNVMMWLFIGLPVCVVCGYGIIQLVDGLGRLRASKKMRESVK